MASSAIQGEWEKTKMESSLLDSGMVQMLQDHFCPANNVYCVCLNKDEGVLTRAYGTRKELDYLHGKMGMDRHISLMRRLMENDIEDIIEEELEEDYLKMCGVAIKAGGKRIAIWIVLGVIEEPGIHGEDVPGYIKTTTRERFLSSIAFLESLTRQYFAIKMEEVIAQEAFIQSRESEEKLKKELERSGAMTQVVSLLESEKPFADIVMRVLEEVCGHLDISAASMFQIDRENQYLNMICHWGYTDQELLKSMRHMPLEEVPWANGKPYLISSDTYLPEKFLKYFQTYKRRAGIFLPVDVNGKASMYLVFVEERYERRWTQEEIKFIKDVRHIVQSILTKRITKNSLASSYASLEAILENMGCGVFVADLVAENALYANHQFKELFKGYLNNHSLQDLIRKYKTDDRMHQPLSEMYIQEFNKWYDVQLTSINWVDGKSVTLCTVYDVTDKKLYQQKIEKQANNDFLTGLYNRMRCESDLKEYIHRVKEEGGQGALLYIDLDDFKHINDGLGHQYGDILLKAISNSLRRIKGIEDSCYRMGGDEFIIIITQQSYYRFDQILEEIREIFNKPWFLQRADYYCTMSMGIVRFPEDANTVTDLIKKADIALYEAKKSGKNQVAYYNEDVESTSFRRLDMEKNMRDATANACQEFEVYYQPVIDIAGGRERCSGVEALVRWNSEKMGMVGPSEFIPLAEYLGLINPIGEFVLRKACEKCKYWNDMGHPEYHVNVNLSVVQLLQNDIAERIREVLEETGMRPENLTLEVTESLAINDMGRMKKILSQIKELGASIALDDFGTGYSSLSHIRELPIDIIKIDRCFVIDIDKDEYAEAFVKMVAELADTIGVRICVEGVELESQLDKLRQMKKVQYIQGYYYDKPLKEEEFEAKYL